MVERTPILNFFTHLTLFIGFLLAVAPFAMVAIASTHNLTDVNRVPMSLIPGSDFWATGVDPKTITDGPANSEDEETYTNSRIRKAPLPGVAVGAGGGNG